MCFDHTNCVFIMFLYQKRSCEEAEKRRTLLPDIPFDEDEQVEENGVSFSVSFSARSGTGSC